MATIDSGQNAATKLNVDPRWGAGRVALRPFDTPAAEGVDVGYYQLGAQSGALTSAAVAANDSLFSIRWTAAGKVALITRIAARLVPTATAFTGVQEIGLALRRLNQFTSFDTGGTALAPAAGSNQLDARRPLPLLTDCMIAGTATLSSGTRTRGANPLAMAVGVANDLNVAAGTQQPIAGWPVLTWEANQARGEHPLVLYPNEGLAIENTVVFPAAGTARFQVDVSWIETPGY